MVKDCFEMTRKYYKCLNYSGVNLQNYYISLNKKLRKQVSTNYTLY